METKRVTDMLMDSAEQIHNLLKNPGEYEMENAKLLIAGANTLAQTVKAMVQTEVIGLKLAQSKGNTTQLIHHIVDGE